MRRIAVAVLLAALIGLGWWWAHWHTGIEAAMLAAARSGQFQRPVDGNSYSGGIEWVDRPHAFHGAGTGVDPNRELAC